MESCHRCPGKALPPVTAAIALVLLAGVLVIAVLSNILERLAFRLKARQGSRVAKVATGALRELRRVAAQVYPSGQHAWFGASDVEATSPLLCVACLGYIPPLTTGQSLRCCACCGVVAHDGCVRHVGETCRPFTVPAAPLPHCWQATGTARDDQQHAMASGDSALSQQCLYCGERNGGEAHAAEPAWRCSCCGVLAHVQCFCAAHPELPSVSDKFAALQRDQGNKAAASANASLQEGDVADDASDGGASTSSSSSKASGSLGARGARLRKQQQSSKGNLAGNAAAEAATDGSDVDIVQQRLRRLQAIRSGDVKQLDSCSLGTLRQLILPPTCVKPAKEIAASASNARQQQQQVVAGEQAPSAAAPRRGSGSKQSKRKGRRQGSGKRRDASWWHRAFAPRPPQWHEWRLDPLPPPGSKPVLVFINVKSGPQVGEQLRHSFLRILHPLQVVTLPRNAPDPALRLFAHLPGLRLLVVGGDGTVGWVLSCLDSLAQALRAEGHSGWKPPPVAVMPLGTGNDLARCLGWGAGYSTWSQEGAAGILREVARAPVALLDRWEVVFEPPAPPPLEPVAARNLLSPRGAVGAAVGAARRGARRATSSPAPQRRSLAMNNYLGVGVDAKVALEFHRMREAYPHWFQSQMGNKILYTGMGAKDIVEGAPLNLAERIRVECDGTEVHLPPGCQGLLLLSIPSYMGGLDLWRSGVDWPPQEQQQQHSPQPSAQQRRDHTANGSAHALSSSNAAAGFAARPLRPQSMCDGVIEVVAVYGSWHLGQLTVGLARAMRLAQGRRVTLTCHEALPMQVDGEPFQQAAGIVGVARKGQALVLRRVASAPLAAVVRAVQEVLDGGQQEGVISQAQHDWLTKEMAGRLQQLG